MSLRALPKVELHLHLDCSLSYAAVSRLDPAVSHEEYRRRFVAPPKCRDLADMISRATAAVELMQTVEQLRLVTADLFDQLQHDNVIYAEIRFAPLLHTARGLSPEAVVAAVDEAAAGASRATGIEVRLILCTLRHFSTAQSMETVRLVERFAGTRVAALDIAGDEARFALAPHVAAFRYAAERGIPYTAHAGEASGAESVWETLRELRPSRIGHGVRSSEDPALITALREQEVHLEVCPTTNVQSGIYDTYADHAIPRLLDAGVPLSVSTDARTISDVTLAGEYERLAGAFNWEKGHFLACNRAALRAAFIPNALRGGLERRLLQESGDG